MRTTDLSREIERKSAQRIYILHSTPVNSYLKVNANGIDCSSFARQTHN